MTGIERRRVAIVVTLALVALLSTQLLASEDRLRRHVEFLASEELEGRLTGTEGARKAAEYIARELKQFGALPLPGSDGFLRPFEFTAGTNDIGSSLTLDGEKPQTWTGVEQVRALSFSDDGSVSAPVVFAGYGLKVPDGKELSYDSYHGLDVENKIVVVLRYSPEDVDDEMRAELRRYSGLRYKALQAREHGATGLLVVTGPRSPNAGETIESKFDTALSGSGILGGSISGAIAERLFSGIEGGLDKAQADLDTGNPHVSGFEFPDLQLTLEIKIERERRTARNVIGMLPATGDSDGVPVLLGAHFDHLGHGRQGNSLARKEEEGQIHYGADDNASGVAAVLEAGRALAARERRGPIFLAFWTGEELGLLGSDHFAAAPPEVAANLGAYLNFDMVGRVDDNRLDLQGVGSSPVWGRLIERANVPVGFDIHTQEDPYLPTDASSFYKAGIPIAAFFTGSHEDYHRPTDRADKINYEDLERVVQFATGFAFAVGQLPETPAYVKVERKVEPGGDSAGARAYTGTIPDYTTEVEGLRLSGVIAGGPAEAAGLAEGDVIVEFAGRSVANIYDYMYALEAVKIGQPAEVVCLRGEERMQFTITPTARP